MKAHVVVDAESQEPTTVRPSEGHDDFWDALSDLGVNLEELSVVSEMSLHTAVFALQQIELHLEGVNIDGPLAKLFERTEESHPAPPSDELRGVLSRIRVLVTTTLVSLGVLGDLETGEDGKPVPVELPSMGIEEQQATLRSLTAGRELVDPDASPFRMPSGE